MMDGCFPDKPVASGKRVWLGFQEFVVEFLNIRRHVSRKGRANRGNRQEGQKLREAWGGSLDYSPLSCSLSAAAGATSSSSGSIHSLRSSELLITFFREAE